MIMKPSVETINRNHQLKPSRTKISRENKRPLTRTNDIIKADISTNNKEDALTENNHILENNNKTNLNRRHKLLKYANTGK